MGCIRYELSDHVAWITLDAPETMNALSVELAAQLREALAEVSTQRGLRALALTGTGRGFCAGGDVASFHDNLDAAPAYLRSVIFNLHTAISYMMNLEAPVIAGINGVTAGAGMGLAMAADLALATHSAVFTMAYTAIGASPDGSSTFFLPRLVGTRRAMEMALTNRRLSATEAEEWGLVNRVVADESFDDEFRELVAKIAAGPTLAYARTRRLIRDSAHTPMPVQLEREGHAIVEMGASEDFREGVSAFVTKRRAAFKGR